MESLEQIGPKKIDINSLKNLRKELKYTIKCPICSEKEEIHIEIGHLQKVENSPFPHIHLHGNPLHVLILYIDNNLMVRGIERSDSIEIKKDANTLDQIIKKWANPF